MLQIKNICKEYKTGNLVQKALQGASLNLRENEFVAILGPSGSGKTTLLNIIGGLDRYDSGDLIINGISTKKYKDRDWDSYRNHTIGFVFQSYNLIVHQTVLANVELALTISGVSKSERKRRAKQALEQVGLGNQLHKRPNQLSGGQMQRVAIARALVNDPDILLADEPTGALDSETSIQVMELLKKVAKDRLVVMVTHNPELAKSYATRIVNLKDGKIISDSNPFIIDEKSMKTPIHKTMGKASMSFLTALSLSFNNLRTKKARTLLTSFAGSIGIIGIALILALSNGVNAYIKFIEEDTLSEYPLQIQSTGMDMTSMMLSAHNEKAEGIDGEVNVSEMITGMLSKVDANDLSSLKQYFDSGESGIEQYTNAIEYTYGIAPQIFYQKDDKVRQVNPDRSFSALGIDSSSNSNSFMSMMMSTDVFHAMPKNTELFQSQYDVKAGHWPEKYNECVVVLTPGGSISDFMLYTLGLRDSVELDTMIKQFMDEEDIETPDDIRPYAYEEFLGITFKLVNPADYYVYDKEYDVWKDKSDDKEYMKKLVSNGEEIKIVGIVQPREASAGAMLMSGIGYPASLTEHVISEAKKEGIVKKQLENPKINVLTGKPFGEESDRNKLNAESLFKIDEDALKKAFSFDENILSTDLSNISSSVGSTSDLSDMLDLKNIKLDIPELSGINMEDIIGDFDLSVSPENMQKLFYNIFKGYEEYIANNSEADFSDMNKHFTEYLQTPQARQKLSESMASILASNGNITISKEQTTELMRELMTGFQKYSSDNKLNDSEKFGEYFQSYLETPQAKQIITEKASDIININKDLSISPEQMQAISKDILAGYQEYASENNLPNPNKMMEYFMEYLQSPQVQQNLNEGILGMMNTEKLKEQISTSISVYMQTAMSSFTNAIEQGIKTQISSVMQKMTSQISKGIEDSLKQSMEKMGSAISIDPKAFADAIQMDMDEEELSQLLYALMSGEDTSYDSNLKKFGYAELNNPSQIDIYPCDFESKESIIEILDSYNDKMEANGMDEKVISYTDLVGTLMSSVTQIVDTISYILVAFVAISLIVSSIMIGVITYISVLERKKEIGILRAIGASKRNISQVFNAETFIVGLCAGIIGIGLSLLILIPGNALIHYLTGQTNINAVIPAFSACVLIALSVLLTLLGGLIPSKKASKSDPVTALRTE